MIAEARRKKIDKLLDVFLDDLQSLTHDAGWHGDSEIGRWQQIGILPPPKHRYVKSNAKMLYEAQFLREHHALLPDAKALVRSISRKRNKRGVLNGNKYAEAMLARRFYTHDFLDPADRKVKQYNDRHRAFHVGQSLRSFKRRIKVGYELADEILTILEIRKEIEEEAA